MTIWAAIFASLLASAIGEGPSSQARAEFNALLHRAFDFHQKNEYDQALPLLRDARRLRPHDYFVNLLLGIELLRTSQGAKSLPFLKEAARTNPREETPYQYLGEAQAGLRNYGEAFVAFDRAVRLAPQSPQTTVPSVDFCLARYAALAARLRSSQAGLAAEYRLQAMARPMNDTERVSLLLRAISLNENEPGVWGDLAMTELVNGNVTSAKQYIQRALEHDPNDLRAWEAEAMLAASQGDWVLAITRLNAMHERSPTFLAHAVVDWPRSQRLPATSKKVGPGVAFLQCAEEDEKICPPEVLLHRLATHGAAKEKSEAAPDVLFREQRWENLLSRPDPPPAESAAWTRRGIAFTKLDDCDHAIPSFERGLASHSDHAYDLELLSMCYARQAGTIASRLKESGGDDALLHMMRGDILLRLHADSAGALAEYQSAQARHGDDPDILQRIAEAQLGAGQIDPARENAKAALRLDPHSYPAMRTLARIAMQDRNYVDALPYLRQLVKLDPKDLTARVELGTACAQTEALEEALNNLSPPLESGYPDEKGSLHYLLGTVLQHMGRSDRAEQAFAQASKLSNDFQHNSRQDAHEQP
jgi:tetratricopeptide (TPR) repeat protein